jgi:hypothetical protein
MRTLTLLVGLSALSATALSAQHRWQRLEAPTSARLSIDLQSLKAAGNIVSVDVRTPIGGGMYEIQPHDVRCTDLSIRLGPARSYDADAPRPTPQPPSARPRSSSTWTRYSPKSDGQLTASAICSVARKRGLLPQQTTFVG